MAFPCIPTRTQRTDNVRPWGHLRKEANGDFKEGLNEAHRKPIAGVCNVEGEDVGEDNGE